MPGGHLGMLTGRGPRGTTWQIMDEWIDQWSSDAEDGPDPRGQEDRRRGRPAGKKAAANEGGRQEAAAKPRRSRRTATIATATSATA